MKQNRLSGSNRKLRLPVRMAVVFVLGVAAQAFGQGAVRPEVVEPAPGDSDETVLPALPVESGKPKNPEDDLWDFAVQLLSLKDYKLAVGQFEKFIEHNPRSSRVPEAYYRIGDCHLKLKNLEDAEAAFLNTLRHTREGNFAGAAAYRLGRFSYSRADYAKAETFFAMAEAEVENEETRVTSLYLRARSINQQKRRADAIVQYQRLIDLGGENMFRASALREVAVEQMKAGEKDKALANFLKVTQEIDPARLEANPDFPSSDDRWALLAEAMVSMGMIYEERKEHDKAIDWFTKAVMLSDPKGAATKWKSFASFSVVHSKYAAGDYEGVVRAYESAKGAIYSDKTQPTLLLSVGNSFRKLKRHTEAVQVFIKLESEYPGTTEALEAGYRKLLSFHAMQSSELPDFVDRYIRRYEREFPNNELLDRAALLKAEGLFGNEDYELAAEYYGKLNIDNIPEKLRPSVMYKKGWAEAEAGKPEAAIDTFSLYLGRYKEAADTASALAKRAQCYKKVNDFPNALRDLEKIVANHPDSPVVELALQRSALLKGETRDLNGMIQDFEMLLEKFPESIAAAEANYWIGWASFELREFGNAIGPLKKAAELDPANYRDKIALRIVLCNYYTENLDGLTAELEGYLEDHGAANIPANVFYWIGVEKFKRDDFVAADKYLTLSTDPIQEEVPVVVWDNMARARLAIGNYQGAVEAIDQYLLDDKKPGTYLAKAYLVRARAQLGLLQLEEAEESCAKGLEKVKEGRVNAELTICRGDIALASGKALQEAGKNSEAAAKYKEAVGQFVRVSQIFVDREITPTAMSKWATALDRLGDRDKAAKIREQLRADYPGFQLSAGG